MSLVGFLQASKARLKNLHEYEYFHVVCGNESCDLDSVVSAIVYAYFLQQVLDEDQKERTFSIPMLNIPEADFSLHTETVYALGLYDITAKDLVFFDQVDLAQHQDKLRLTLVDFHVLPQRLEFLEKSVVEILDHRKRECQHRESVDVTIELVGSCCTLVAEKIHQRLTLKELPKEASWLLYGTILVDTVCLLESAGRTTPKDVAMIDDLESILPNPKRRQVFDKLCAAKNDVSGLTTYDVLRKDLKVVGNGDARIAMSSIPIHIKDFLSRPDLLPALSSFTTHQEALATVILALVVDPQGEPHRQLAVYANQRNILEQVAQELRLPSSNLNLSELSATPSSARNELSSALSVFSQGNVKASRKIVSPIIKNWLGRNDLSPNQAKDEL